MWNVEGREFVNMCTGHGASLLGYGHPAVRRAVEQALDIGRHLRLRDALS